MINTFARNLISNPETALKFVNKFLKQFESSPLEEEFWNKTYNINELKMIRNKLKLVLEDA